MKYINAVKEILHQITYILTYKQKRAFYGLFIITLIGSLLVMLGIYVILPFIQAVMSPETLLNSGFTGLMAEILHISDSEKMLILMGGFVVSVYILMNVFLIFVEYK